MASDVSNTANAFAATACKLLIEYSARLAAQKEEVKKIVDEYNNPKMGRSPSYLSHKYSSEMSEFMRSREVFDTLVRKASQWVEHGRSPQPHLELELEVRLADFESMLRSMDSFFHENRI